MTILAIDPGNEESGWVLMDAETCEPSHFAKQHNEDLLFLLRREGFVPDHVVIEMVASYGMAVGQTIFDTCVWVGRFIEASQALHTLVYRKDIKMNLCGNTQAKDSNIRQALVDRFSYDRHKAKGGKGTKADPGWFYGFKSDIWAAYALGVTYIDKERT